jgi:hypothetical protein
VTGEPRIEEAAEHARDFDVVVGEHSLTWSWARPAHRLHELADELGPQPCDARHVSQGVLVTSAQGRFDRQGRQTSVVLGLDEVRLGAARIPKPPDKLFSIAHQRIIARPARSVMVRAPPAPYDRGGGKSVVERQAHGRDRAWRLADSRRRAPSMAA